MNITIENLHTTLILDAMFMVLYLCFIFIMAGIDKEYRKIAVLGDMFELGDYSADLHRKVGDEVVKNNIDILVCAGENAKLIADEALENGMKKENIYIC